MATSNGGGNDPGGPGDRVWAYLTSARHYVASGAAVAGAGAAIGLQSPVALSALLVAGPYVATVSLWRRKPSEGLGGPEESEELLGVSLSVQRPTPRPAPPVSEAPRAAPASPASAPAPAPAPSRLWPQLEELAAFVGSAPLPSSANVPGLLARLRTAGPGPTTEPIVRRRLPLAVDGYLRALTWQPWAADGADPAAELARAVDEMAALVPAS
ncbi:hypothetical protein [Streptomyces sp. NRRL S-495]|uniref:hypothetical protein n=1 Tax=Streptomyces sp. NRRL S-495 TaxID=1609133 RepID=UPI0005F8B004|nr:hypothetical protein [Streptomyces sp. NRRL S-495]KJY35066.1 hypothetical protein VR45_15155 [Streptomyces sp. NRRL S-495]